MINHGLITGGLFLLVGVIYERTHDRTIAKMGGLAATMPIWATGFGFFILASAGLPGLSGFVGEFLVFVGSFGVAPGDRRRLDHRHGPGRHVPAVDVPARGLRRLSDFLAGLGGHLTDMTRTSWSPSLPLAVLIVVLGLFPSLLLDLLRAPPRRSWRRPRRSAAERRAR
jgi:NADH-quinone oxidoreductase subunit M